MTAIENKVIAAISISKNVSAILDSFVAQDDICYGTQRALSSLLSKQDKELLECRELIDIEIKKIASKNILGVSLESATLYKSLHYAGIIFPNIFGTTLLLLKSGEESYAAKVSGLVLLAVGQICSQINHIISTGKIAEEIRRNKLSELKERCGGVLTAIDPLQTFLNFNPSTQSLKGDESLKIEGDGIDEVDGFISHFEDEIIALEDEKYIFKGDLVNNYRKSIKNMIEPRRNPLGGVGVDPVFFTVP